MPTSTTGRCPLWLPLAAGSMVIVGLVAAFSTIALAQKTVPPKKSDPAGKTEPKVVVDIMVNTAGGVEQVRYINELIEKGWKDNKITPSDRCTDYEFIRRASLDIIGRIAKVNEITRFFEDPPERRRSKLIERLLGNDPKKPSDEYANNWANLWTVLLLTRTGVGKLYQEQMHEWLADQLTEKFDSPGSKKPTYVPDWSKIATALISAQGETNENGAVNFVLAHLGDEIKEDRGANGKYEMVPVTSRTTRLFLGLRTQCVQCHDHPFNGEWGQHHFWGINAFFRQVDPNGRPGMMMKKNKKDLGMQKFAVKDNPSFNVKALVSYERRSGVLLYTDPTFLDGKKMPSIKDPSKTTRRQELTKFIVASPYFAKAYINRVWGHFFGKSFTKDAVDDFGEHNPVSNPELLDKLAEDWSKKYNHSPKDLIRWICNSKAYGLSSAANKTNDKPEDEVFFSRMLLKAMTPEQLFESLMTATQAKVGQNSQAKAKLREEWLDKLIVNFGNDEGEEGSFNGTVIQALMLMNGQDINTAITDKDTGTVANVIRKRSASQKALQEAMKDLYLAALNRPPRADEYAKVLNPKMWNFRTARPLNEAFWVSFYQDLFWGALNSAEFILNH